MKDGASIHTFDMKIRTVHHNELYSIRSIPTHHRQNPTEIKYITSFHTHQN